MPFGQSRYEDVNALLNAKFAEKKVLICAHRGSWHGNVIQNTTIAYRAALMQGADIVETDTTATRDGEVFSLHDGVEWRLFGQPRSGLKLTGERLASLDTLNALGEPSAHPAQRLGEVFDFLTHGELINVDRIWRAKDLVLPLLDKYPHMLRQAILKAPPDATAIYEQLENHPVKYMFMPICRSYREIEEALSYKNINTVGVEMIAATEKDELYQDEAFRYVHDKGLFCWVNALTLSGRYAETALFGELDDDNSIWRGPAQGWGRLMDKGVDAIQTDWPALVRDYRKERMGV
ncbi:MAG: glycerophosphodiester phosphodiesterase family protein [Clostridia bacterium]|nr:glycerophosphodiester phosphodiesterase family protein [Clostridia bacterium]